MERKKTEIIDLCCSTGTIGQIVADMTDKVVGIEIIEEVVVTAIETENPRIYDLMGKMGYY